MIFMFMRQHARGLLRCTLKEATEKLRSEIPEQVYNYAVDKELWAETSYS